jgi:hypothetical protein
MQLGFNLNSIEEKWDANWYESFSKFACNYGVGKKTCQKKRKKYTYYNLELYKGKLIDFFFDET